MFQPISTWTSKVLVDFCFIVNFIWYDLMSVYDGGSCFQSLLNWPIFTEICQG